jgi:multidrug efflux system outer membrane protein
VERERNNYRAALNVSYEVDLWGRLRATTQAARAELLASEAARDTVRIALAADVAKAYFALRSLDAQVESTRRTLGLREDGLKLQQKRFAGGVISEYDYRQLEAETAAARAQLPPLERDREIQEAALAVLLGRSPKEIMEGSVSRAENSPGQLLAAVVPAGLPSELMLRRPDLVEAEQRLIAANARVAVARSAYFPSIQLTGMLGSEAQMLSSLFSGPAGIWSFAAAVAAPIFAGGRLEALVGASEAREKQALAGYQGAIQNAFREVRAALAAQGRAMEAFEAERARATALSATLRLARLRYDNGLASQLDVIDAQRNLLAAEIARHEALRAQRAAVADLYKALGG